VKVSGTSAKAIPAKTSDAPPILGVTGAPPDDLPIAEPAQFRMVVVSFLAAGVGLLAGLIAFGLYKLIGLITNIVFYHRFVADFISPRHNQLGLWVIGMPVIGGIIVGFMAKYGSSKLRATESPKRWKRSL